MLQLFCAYKISYVHVMLLPMTNFLYFYNVRSEICAQLQVWMFSEVAWYLVYADQVLCE